MNKVKTKNVSALTARTQFGQVMERASGNRERFVVTKKGQAKVMIMGLADFARISGEQPEFLTRSQREAEKSGASKLTMRDINREIAAYRRERAEKNKTRG